MFRRNNFILVGIVIFLMTIVSLVSVGTASADGGPKATPTAKHEGNGQPGGPQGNPVETGNSNGDKNGKPGDPGNNHASENGCKNGEPDCGPKPPATATPCPNKDKHPKPTQTPEPEPESEPPSATATATQQPPAGQPSADQPPAAPQPPASQGQQNQVAYVAPATPAPSPTPKVSDCSVRDMILAQVRDGDQTDIWIYRPGVKDGKGAFKVTWRPELKGQNVNASFSPNGCKIVLSNAGRLFVVSIDGSSVEQITATGDDIQPNWASDWSIYFVRNGTLFVTDQWGHSPKSNKPDSLNIEGFLPHASPDTTSLVFISPFGQISLMNTTSKGITMLPIEANNAIWDPKGKGLVYTTRTTEQFWFYDFATHTTSKVGRPFESRQIVLDPTGLDRMAVAQAIPLETPQLWLEGENSNFVLNLPSQEGLAFPDWWVPANKRAQFDQTFVTSFLATTASDLSF